MQKVLSFIVAFSLVQAVWAQQTFYVNRSVSYSEKLGVLPAMYDASPFEYKMVLKDNGDLITYSASDNFLDELKQVRRLREGTFPVFQLDATAYPGQSGSPLYDGASGEVVGIINMVLVKSTRESALSQPSGISYAIPSRALIELLARVKR